LQAADGEEALAAVGRHAPDLIILDVMMPEPDGLEVCRRLKDSTASEFRTGHSGDREGQY
jgi:CheY-like chemotaxis protein